MAKITFPPREPSWLEKYGATLVALFVALMALVGTLASAHFQREANRYVADQSLRAAQRQADTKMVEIAVGILRAPINDDLAQIRTWAMDVIDAGSSRKFTKDERAALLKNSLPSTDIAAMKFQSMEDICTGSRPLHLKDRDWMTLLEYLCSQKAKQGAAPENSPQSIAPVQRP